MIVGDSKAQREKIFSTRCTIKQKVCSLIIGGMCTNIVFQALVSKLQLQTIPHPQPYTIQHRNQSKSLLVSQVVLLHFSIGKVYQGEIWCDVFPIDTCHVLLGWPWLFDRKLMHDGYHNTYSFTKDHKHITLTPITTSKPTQNFNMETPSPFLTSPNTPKYLELEPRVDISINNLYVKKRSRKVHLNLCLLQSNNNMKRHVQ